MPKKPKTIKTIYWLLSNLTINCLIKQSNRIWIPDKNLHKGQRAVEEQSKQSKQKMYWNTKYQIPDKILNFKV